MERVVKIGAARVREAGRAKFTKFLGWGVLLGIPARRRHGASAGQDGSIVRHFQTAVAARIAAAIMVP